jgi:hypothetical protein
MKEEKNNHGWSSVDHTTDPGYFRDYIDTVSATELMQNADKVGNFFCAVTGFLVRGCKPM